MGPWPPVAQRDCCCRHRCPPAGRHRAGRTLAELAARPRLRASRRQQIVAASSWSSSLSGRRLASGARCGNKVLVHVDGGGCLTLEAAVGSSTASVALLAVVAGAACAYLEDIQNKLSTRAALASRSGLVVLGARRCSLNDCLGLLSQYVSSSSSVSDRVCGAFRVSDCVPSQLLEDV